MRFFLVTFLLVFLHANQVLACSCYMPDKRSEQALSVYSNEFIADVKILGYDGQKFKVKTLSNIKGRLPDEFMLTAWNAKQNGFYYDSMCGSGVSENIRDLLVFTYDAKDQSYHLAGGCNQVLVRSLGTEELEGLYLNLPPFIFYPFWKLIGATPLVGGTIFAFIILALGYSISFIKRVTRK